MPQLYTLVWIAFITCVFLVWFFSHRAKHKERMMMIEKGINVEEIIKTGKKFRLPWLKLGIVIIGLSIGLFIIVVLVMLDKLDKGGNVLPLAILGLCGGGAMVVANYVNKDNDKQ